jgi:hypothetical protein
MLFLTLFWFTHYPTLGLISAIFGMHERTIIRILKQTIEGMKSKLKNEVQWSSDDVLESKLKDFTFFQNSDFEDVVCVVDGTEIRVSRPSIEPYQTKLYSGKKKHSLNVLFIVLLTGEIIFCSPFRIGSHDQAQWNELKLREKFIDKNFGIIGDGGFTFNRKTDTVNMRGYKPKKAKPGEQLSENDKAIGKTLESLQGRCF